MQGPTEPFSFPTVTQADKGKQPATQRPQPSTNKEGPAEPSSSPAAGPTYKEKERESQGVDPTVADDRRQRSGDEWLESMFILEEEAVRRLRQNGFLKVGCSQGGMA